MAFADEDDQMWTYEEAGQIIDWEGPSIYESGQSTPSVSDASGYAGTPQRLNGIPPSSAPKTLLLKSQLGPRQPCSPIWLCETTTDNGKTVQVVLKLFCLELSQKLTAAEVIEYFQAADSDGVEQIWDQLPSPELRCYREAMAYSQLRELQGKCIPRSYGFYRFEFPKCTQLGDEPVIGHVMEYLQGKEPQEIVWALAKRGKDEVKAEVSLLMNAIFDAYREIHARRVAHQDPASRNMRVYWNDEQDTPPRVVVFDFDRCHFGQNWGIRRDESDEMETFLNAIGTWNERLPLRHWIENEGRDIFRDFGKNLLQPRLRNAWKEAQRRSEESVVKSDYVPSSEPEPYGEGWL